MAACRKDEYATNLPLTGYAIWFGAYNMVGLVSATVANLASFGGGRRVLELGAGVGMAGLCIAKMVQAQYRLDKDALVAAEDSGPPHHGDTTGSCSEGIENFVLTDGQDELLPMLGANMAANALKVQCKRLLWGPGPDLEDMLTAHPGGFDTIFGADLVYSADQCAVLPLLFHTVRALLADDPDARFYLAVTRRNFDVDQITDCAERHGFEHAVDEDTIFDIFNNDIPEQNMFWRDAIYVFHRRPPAANNDAGEVV